MRSVYRNTSQKIVSDQTNLWKTSGNPIYPFPDQGQSPTTTIEVDQSWEKNAAGIWEPLGPISSNTWTYTLPTWTFSSVGGAHGAIEAVYELPELASYAGLPSSIYIYFSFNSGELQIDRTSDWSCLLDFGKLFEGGTLSSPTYYVTEAIACFGGNFFGKLRPRFTEVPSVSLKVDGYWSGTNVGDPWNCINCTVAGAATDLA